jgi:beta-phosphoglucomutase
LKEYKAVLFDFDGTIADTMCDLYQSWKYVFNPYFCLMPEEYYILEGMKRADLIRELMNKHNVEDLNIEKLNNDQDAHYLTNYTLKVYPGVEDLIYALKKKRVLTAIVTAGRMIRLKTSAPVALLNTFDAIVTCEKLKGKPAPDGYLEAARQLNVTPNECLVIENAPLGIKSAKAANMYCLGITNTLSKEYLKEADKVFNSFFTLSDFVLELV